MLENYKPHLLWLQKMPTICIKLLHGVWSIYDWSFTLSYLTVIPPQYVALVAWSFPLKRPGKCRQLILNLEWHWMHHLLEILQLSRPRNECPELKYSGLRTISQFEDMFHQINLTVNSYILHSNRGQNRSIRPKLNKEIIMMTLLSSCLLSSSRAEHLRSPWPFTRTSMSIDHVMVYSPCRVPNP